MHLYFSTQRGNISDSQPVKQIRDTPLDNYKGVGVVDGPLNICERSGEWLTDYLIYVKGVGRLTDHLIYVKGVGKVDGPLDICERSEAVDRPLDICEC